MFTGSIPIVLDTLKQHYFIDRYYYYISLTKVKYFVLKAEN